MSRNHQDAPIGLWMCTELFTECPTCGAHIEEPSGELGKFLQLLIEHENEGCEPDPPPPPQFALTKPQERLLARVRESGPLAFLAFNGRARPVIEALEAAKLVTADYDLIIPANGKTHWRITVTAVPQEAHDA